MTNAHNLQSINQEQTLNLCRFYMRIGQNMLMLGRRGIGKTFIAMQSAIECGYKINYINLSVVERADLMGFPRMNDDGDLITYKSPYYLPPLKNNQKPDSIILFDEIDKCAPENTHPLLEILQFRTINNKPINAVSCVLTGNLINEQAYSNNLSTALLDRCSKYVLEFDFNVWIGWAREHNIHPLVLGFLMGNQELAVGQIETTEIASPSPRSWCYVSDCLIKAEEQKITDITTIIHIVAGFVGVEAALKFENYVRYSQKFEHIILSLVEKGQYNLAYNTLEPMEQLVFCIMMCYNAKNRIMNSNTNKKKMKYLDYICAFLVDQKVAPEVQFVALGNAFNFETMIVPHKLYEHGAFLKLHSTLTDNTQI